MLTKEQLQNIFSGKYYHPTYRQTTDLAEQLRVHADGLYPDALINERRPNESEAVRDYRAKIWKANTKPYFNKVFTSLAKIRRSTEWSLKFDQGSVPPRIADGETLEQYLNKDFPQFTSITNWAFSLLLRNYGVDANAWVAVLPNSNAAPNEYLKPRPIIYRSEQVVDYQEGVYIAVKSDEKAIYTDDSGRQQFGDRYIIITTETYEQWDQTGKDRRFALSWEYKHDLGALPAVKMRGVVSGNADGILIQESRLAPMLPSLDEALREYSDLQAEVVQHIHSEKWEYSNDECPECKGTGATPAAGFGSHDRTCGACKGTGIKPRGPYTTLTLRPPMVGESLNMPTPPIGYVQKDTTIVKVQDERVRAHIYDALSAINMEFLAERPLAESGVAKAYDADETNNFAHAVAEDIVAVMDDVCRLICDLRYGVIVPDKTARHAMLPVIAVPERFDLFSASVIEQELANAKEKKINPVLISAMEVNYAAKKFIDTPGVADRLQLILSLDPLPNITEEDKMMRLQNAGISKETYVISSNIQEFVARALDEDADFAGKVLVTQKETLKKFALEITGAADTARKILAPAESTPPLTERVPE